MAAEECGQWPRAFYTASTRKRSIFRTESAPESAHATQSELPPSDRSDTHGSPQAGYHKAHRRADPSW